MLKPRISVRHDLLSASQCLVSLANVDPETAPPILRVS